MKKGLLREMYRLTENTMKALMILEMRLSRIEARFDEIDLKKAHEAAGYVKRPLTHEELKKIVNNLRSDLEEMDKTREESEKEKKEERNLSLSSLLELDEGKNLKEPGYLRSQALDVAITTSNMIYQSFEWLENCFGKPIDAVLQHLEENPEILSFDLLDRRLAI